MGFDTSYHPLDLRFIHGTLVPALLSGEGLAEIEASAARRAKVRYLAKAWALGSLRARDTARERASKAVPPLPDAPPAPARSGLLGRLFGKPSPAAPRVDVVAPPAWLDRLDSDLHVWGRPYFIG